MEIKNFTSQKKKIRKWKQAQNIRTKQTLKLFLLWKKKTTQNKRTKNKRTKQNHKPKKTPDQTTHLVSDEAVDQGFIQPLQVYEALLSPSSWALHV